MEGRWQATERLFLAGNFAYLDAEFDDFENAPCYALQQAGCENNVQDLSGRPTQFSPYWAANLHAEYVLPINDGLETMFSVDVIYSDDYFLATDLDPNLVQDSYTKWDARIALRSTDGDWEVAVIGRNLSDEETTVWGNDAAAGPPFAGTYYQHLDPLRTIAVQGTLRF